MPSPHGVSCLPALQLQPVPQEGPAQSGSKQSVARSPSLSVPSPQADSALTPPSVQAQPLPQISPAQWATSRQSRRPLLSLSTPSSQWPRSAPPSPQLERPTQSSSAQSIFWSPSSSRRL